MVPGGNRTKLAGQRLAFKSKVPGDESRAAISNLGVCFVREQGHTLVTSHLG
jgi:hypothetical protein